jgi:hypothetical protein
MTAPDDQLSVIPPPLEGDDDDVAWAIQTASVQWKRGARADAVVWLRRAVESAMELGQVERAQQINVTITEVEERIVAAVFSRPPTEPPAAGSAEIDALIGLAPDPGRGSIDVEFDDQIDFEEGEDEETDVTHQPEQLMQQAVEARPHRVRPPPPPSAMPRPPSVAPADFEPPPHAPLPDDEVAPSSEPTFMTGSGPAPSEPPLEVPYQDDEETTINAQEPLESAVPPPPPSEAAVSESEPPVVGDLASLSEFPAAEAATEPEPAPSEPPAPEEPALAEAPAPAEDDGEPRIRGINLMDVPGLQDLPPEAQEELVRSARLDTLDVDDEVSSFGIALVIEGWASVMPAIADVACSFAQPGDVVFSQGSLESSVALRVVAGETDTVVAVWEREALDAATADCPWVADELRVVADRFQCLAGAAMGPLGERLDDTLRQSVTDRCEVKTLLAGDTVVEQGDDVPGMYIVGAGEVEILDDAGAVTMELGPGDFLFASEVMSAGSAPATARAGSNGALLLFAQRHAAHELMVIVPPLLEILAS